MEIQFEFAAKSNSLLCLDIKVNHSQLWPEPPEVSTQSEHMGRISVNFPMKWCIFKQNVMPRIILINDLILTNERASLEL